MEQILTNFDLAGIAASSGSACTAGSVVAIARIIAMFGNDNPCTTNSIRFSFGNIIRVENVKDAAARVRKLLID